MPEPNQQTTISYAHKEAFCLMQYQDSVTGEIEILWNSRDGVTPFVITSLAGNEAQHVNWQMDRCSPEFVPPCGMRIFVDASPKHAHIREAARDYVDAHWDKGEYRMCESGHWADKETAMEFFLAECTKPGQPTIVEAE